jgi:maltooligosyltrehalose trehalohydrolase
MCAPTEDGYTRRTAHGADMTENSEATDTRVVEATSDRRSAWKLARGATVTDRGVRFEVWAPHAERVVVEASEGSRFLEVPLARLDDGVFEGLATGLKAGADYRFRLSTKGRTLHRPDPVSRSQPYGVHGSSRVVDPTPFRWTDHAWRGPALPEQVIYELHVGAVTPRGTFDAVIELLGALRYLGVTALELMPVAEFPGDRNWGYDGVDLYAPESSYGGAEGLRRLVDAAHRKGLAVILDVVYSHLGPEGNYLGDFGPYFTSRYRTPWGWAVNFDGPDSDQVRRFVVDNALHWISEYHLDGLRLDAVQAIFDTSPTHILEELTQGVHDLAANLGRRVIVIAESDQNDPRLVRSRHAGGFGLDAVWTDDFHHAVHAALTDEQRGYYMDFRGVSPLAKSLRDRFVYDGAHSAFHQRRHGAPATDVPADRFIVFAQNHDQVGNRPRGDRLSTLVPMERLRLAAALVLLSPYVPMLFMGEEYGETNPFLYFVNHDDPNVVAAVREERRREFAAMAWGGDIPDPQAVETFARSRLMRERARRRDRRPLHALYRRLIRLRQEERALIPGAASYAVHGGGELTWVALELHAEGASDLLAVFNLDAAQTIELPIEPRPWDLSLSTDARRWGGSGQEPAVTTIAGRTSVRAPAWSALLYRNAPA